jgi:hypothetical protein
VAPAFPDWWVEHRHMYRRSFANSMIRLHLPTVGRSRGVRAVSGRLSHLNRRMSRRKIDEGREMAFLGSQALVRLAATNRPSLGLRELPILTDFVDLVGQTRGLRSTQSLSDLGDACARPDTPALEPGSGGLEGHRHAPTPAKAGTGRSLASFLRFCAVAASRNSSLAPQGPRSLRRASLRMRLR